MGFFYKGISGNKIRFEVKGCDIPYALQFPECKWTDTITICVPVFDYDFELGGEYFLKIEEGEIKCVWDYSDFVPNYPKDISEKKIKERLEELKVSDDELTEIINRHHQPTFPYVVECRNYTKRCLSLVHPHWTEYFSKLYKNDIPLPPQPYLCETCLENPPEPKKGIIPTPMGKMKRLYNW